MIDEHTLRQELRARDHALYMAYIFSPPYARETNLILCHIFADIHRILYEVTEPMMAYIRLQYWRDSLADPQPSGLLALDAARAQGLKLDSLLSFVDALEQTIETDTKDQFSALPFLQNLLQDNPPVAKRLLRIYRRAHGKTGLRLFFTALLARWV